MIEGFAKVESYKDKYLQLQLSVHSSMEAITHGRGTLFDANNLVAAYNIMEGLWSMGLLECQEELAAACQAIKDFGARQKKTGKFVFTGQELKAINTLLDAHDQVIGQITVNELTEALRRMQEHVTKKTAYVIG